MIKQIKSSELKNYLKNNPNSVLLDVRTKAEWKDGEKPNSEALNSKTYFITVSPDLSNWKAPDPNFVENVKKNAAARPPAEPPAAVQGEPLLFRLQFHYYLIYFPI